MEDVKIARKVVQEAAVNVGNEQAASSSVASNVSNIAANPFMMLDSYLQKMILQDWLYAIDIANFDIATLGRHLGKLTDSIQFHSGYDRKRDRQCFFPIDRIVDYYKKWMQDRKCLPVTVDISLVAQGWRFSIERELISSMQLKLSAISFDGPRLTHPDVLPFLKAYLIEVSLVEASSTMENLSVLRNNCPSLFTLHLQFDGRSPSQELIVLISDSFHLLTSLELTLKGASANLPSALLLSTPFPSLERLTVNKSGSISRDIWASLIDRDRSQNRVDVQLPCLKYLKAPFYFVYQFSFNYGAMPIYFNMQELIVPACEEMHRIYHLSFAAGSMCISFPDLEKVVWEQSGRNIEQILNDLPKAVQISNPDNSLFNHWDMIPSSDAADRVEELTLHFEHEGIITVKDMSNIQRRFRNLRKLAITGKADFRVNDSGFALLRCFAHLQELELHFVNIRSDDEGDDDDDEEEMEKLIVSSMDDYIADLTLLTQLKKLTLVDLQLSDWHIRDILIYMPLLTRFAIFSAVNDEYKSYTNNVLSTIAQNQPNIHSLKLQVWSTITLEAIISFLKQVKKLEHFEIIGGDKKFCSMCTEAMRLALRNQDQNHLEFWLIPKFTRHK